jgi:hypothetical protein
LLAAGLSGCHGRFNRVEKAHGKLWFVFWIARTAEIRCFRIALSLEISLKSNAFQCSPMAQPVSHSAGSLRDIV